MISTSKDCINIWNFMPHVNVLFKIENESAMAMKNHSKILATIDNDCKYCLVYFGSDLEFDVYFFNAKENTMMKRDSFNLVKELRNAGY